MSTTAAKCRVCLASKETASLSTLSQTSVFMLRSIYSSFTILNPNEIKHVSDLKAFNNICSMCETILMLLYEFQQKVVRSERELLEYISTTERNKEGLTLNDVNLLTDTDRQTLSSSPPPSVEAELEDTPEESPASSMFHDQDDELLDDSMDVTEPVIVKAEQTDLEGELPVTKKPLTQKQKAKPTQKQKKKFKKYKSESCLAREAAKHLKPLDTINEKFSCKICNAVIYTRVFALQHVKFEHLSDQTVYRCEQCSYMTQRKHDFSRHVINHSQKGKKSNATKEPVLGIDYTVSEVENEINWKQHVKGFTCKLCHTDFHNKSHLYSHVRETHFRNMLMTYRCSRCSYQTNRRYNLTQHIKIHQKK